jgi:3',5'-cyclic AMP phosphodiesterase CpdA
MSQDAMNALEGQLGGPAPPGLAGLDDDQLRDLVDAIRAARHRQAAELTAASDRALEHIPWLLRIPLRKVLG